MRAAWTFKIFHTGTFPRQHKDQKHLTEDESGDAQHEHDHEGQLHRAQLGTGEGADAADRAGAQDPGPGGLRHRLHALPLGFALPVLLDGSTDDPVTEDERGHGDDVDPRRHPGDVGAQPSRLHKVAPAVAAGTGLAQGEDEVLRRAEGRAARPGTPDHDVGALQRVADGDVAVKCHHHHHAPAGASRCGTGSPNATTRSARLRCFMNR